MISEKLKREETLQINFGILQDLLNRSLTQILDFRQTEAKNQFRMTGYLSKLKDTSNQLLNYLEDYRYSEAFDSIYHFVWDDFADWYIETCKTELNLELLCYVFNNILEANSSICTVCK